MRVLPSGERAVLVELPDIDAVHDLAGLIRAAHDPRVSDVVPAARTVLVVVAEAHDLPAVTDLVARAQTSARRAPGTGAGILRIPVRYDGDDLANVASATGLSVAEVVQRHSSAEYRVDFVGFVPGFAYLSGLDPLLRLPRLVTPRTRVPAGSVAIAGPYAAVYPRESPGGWLLLGRTSAAMFDLDAQPPALLHAGMRVRFEPVTP